MTPKSSHEPRATNHEPRYYIMGIDPGLASTGVGVLEVDGRGGMRALATRVTATSPRTPLPDRLAAIHALVAAALDEFKPTVVAIESIFFAKNVKSAVAMAHGRGAAILAVAEKGITLLEFAPREIKLAVVGRGNATKEQVKKFVGTWLSLREPPRTDHESDALAAALCAALRERHTARTGAASTSTAPPTAAKLLLAQARWRKRRR